MLSFLTPVFPTSTFVIILFESLVLLFGIFQFVLNNDQSNRRFIVLTLMFIQYNLINGFLPNWDYQWVDNIYTSVLFQNVLAYGSGILLATYYFYYLIEELDICIGRFFNVRFLLISLLASFLILYCGTFLVTQDKNLARQVFIGVPCLIAVYFAYNTVHFIIKNRKEKTIPYYRWISFSGYLGIIFMATMPIVLIWGDDHKGLNHLLVNIALLLTVYSHFRRYVQLNRKRIPDLGEAENAKYAHIKSVTTKRELEVAVLIVTSKSFDEIGEIMYISGATVRKHASNLYKKIGVADREEFQIKYRKIKSYVQPFKKIDHSEEE